MRAWHLLGLPSEDGERLRFFPPDSKSPLQLPGSIPVGDQEQIIAFFQQTITENPLPRTEVDWYHNGIDPGPRKFLEGLRVRKGTSGVLLVIKIRSEGINAEEVLADPIAQMFEHTVISSQYHLKNTSLVNLASLTKHVEQTLRELYREMANEINLWRDGWDKLRPLLEVLLNPIDVVETVNSLIDIQLEEVVPEDPTDALKQRLLDRLLTARPCEELIVLSAYLLNNLGAGQELLEDRWAAAENSLQSELLLSEGKLRAWAAWLAETSIDSNRSNALLRAGQKYSNHPDWEETQRWLDPKPHEGAPSSISAKLRGIYGFIAEGKLGRARAELDALNTSVVGQNLPTDIMNEIKRAESLFLRFFANNLSTRGRWDEAAHFFKRAISLNEQGGASPASIAVTLYDYAVGLRDNGRWEEAEPLFKQAILLENEAAVFPTHKAITIGQYARGLRDNGRWEEAEPLFKQAISLNEQGRGTIKSRVATLRAYAEGLRKYGRSSEAEDVERQAELLTAGGH